MKIIDCYYENKNIKITNSWFFGIKLFIDNDIIAINKEYFIVDGTKPIIKVDYMFGTGIKNIEIFCEYIIKLKIKIFINGIFIGGTQEELKDYTNTKWGIYKNKINETLMEKIEENKQLKIIRIFGFISLSFAIFIFINSFLNFDTFKIFINNNLYSLFFIYVSIVFIKYFK